ncbi:fumarylacetoacetase [Paraburkholderia caledonica]|uniref:fumarylacetoacetase n=1 Tax=Paraburkholderia caledonica TaxID=134536 RepID=A0ABU1KYS5_9BURK|nr:fumarylacetoacetase [Paraburkholderia caledonica]MDR6376124.1 fumarylacetoacetase [Paraburkholderia caledonica]
MLDETHDTRLGSWVRSANGHQHFPIQNLPFGVFSPAEGGGARIGVAIGEEVFDLSDAAKLSLLEGLPADIFQQASLEPLMAAGLTTRRQLRKTLSRVLSQEAYADSGARCLRRSVDCEFVVPTTIPDYTDFYAGVYHALAAGKLFRPNEPLLPNYEHLPVGYHGRSSSVIISTADVHRPTGQMNLDQTVQVTKSRKLDFEVEFAIWIGKANERGNPVAIGKASEAVWGYGLLNDWSARDIQAWEYRPLGPFLGKNFATSVSPWVVTPEALAPFRTASFDKGHAVSAYLSDEHDGSSGGLDVILEVLLSTDASREAGLSRFSLANMSTRYLYWTPAQLVAHHTVGGCPLRVGDLLGTGTISGPSSGEEGSLLEATKNGVKPLVLPNGEWRAFLNDGDEVTIRGICEREGAVTIGFGECTGRICD